MRDAQVRNALMIVNPHSSQGSDAQLDAGIERLQAAGIRVEKGSFGSVEESISGIRERKNAVDLVIIGGGDGSVSAMIEILYECQLPLAVLPLGTANDLARSLGVAENLEAAFAAIVDNQRKRIDLGWVNEHYFLNVANLGLGVKVTEELSNTDKKAWGVFSYLKAFFAALARSDRFRVKLSVDGNQHAFSSMHLAVGNGRYYGGGNIIAEDAYIDDGRLSLYSLKPLRLWELLTLAPLLRTGWQSTDRRIFTTHACDVELKTLPDGLPIHADGEPVTHTPAHFKVIPGALEVIVARTHPGNGSH